MFVSLCVCAVVARMRGTSFICLRIKRARSTHLRRACNCSDKKSPCVVQGAFFTPHWRVLPTTLRLLAQTGLDVVGGRVAGVHTETHGTIAAPIVVSCLNIWTGYVSCRHSHPHTHTGTNPPLPSMDHGCARLLVVLYAPACGAQPHMHMCWQLRHIIMRTHMAQN